MGCIQCQRLGVGVRSKLKEVHLYAGARDVRATRKAEVSCMQESSRSQ